MAARWMLAVTLLTGCSFVHARAANDPARGCSRTPEGVDFVIALAAAAAATTVALTTRCDDAERKCNEMTTLFATVGAGGLVTVAALASAAYGADVADRCHAETAKRR